MPEEKDIVAENMEKRRSTRGKHRGPGLFTKLLIALGLIVALIIFSFSSLFTVDTINVEGNSYFTDDEIINMAHATAGRNIIYHPEKSSIKKYLKKSPYIEDVSVHRKLPSTIVIRVKEREQVGAIVYGNEYLIIDKNGVLLRKTETKPKVTILKGITVSSIQLGEKVKASDEDIFNNALKLINAMDDGNLYFVEIDMGELFVKAYVYDTLVCTGTTKEMLSAIKKERLQQIIETLFSRNIKRGTIAISDDGYASFTPDV